MTDYASSIDQLGVLGILPAEQVLQLRPFAGFRNALVHGYLQVDVARVRAVLNQHLDQLRDFARHVERYLAASSVGRHRVDVVAPALNELAATYDSTPVVGAGPPPVPIQPIGRR